MGPTSIESRGTINVPLLFREGRRGRVGIGACISGLSIEEEEESDRSGRFGFVGYVAVSLLMVLSASLSFIG